MSRDPLRDYLRAEERRRRERILYAIVAWCLVIFSAVLVAWVAWGLVSLFIATFS